MTQDATSLLQRFESAEAAAHRLAKVDLGAEARPVVTANGADLPAAARALVAAGMAGDAVSVLAQALERRAAVWWACLAARAEPESPPEDIPAEELPPPGTAVLAPPEAAALAAAESWVREPDAAKAHAALAAAEAADMGSPAACAALAAFFAGDSIAPIGVAPVPPPPHVAGVVSAGAIQLAAVRHRPDLAEQTLSVFVERGFAIAAGRESWENRGRGPSPQVS